MNMQNNTIPPVDYAPPELQGELMAMQKLETEELLEIINGKFPEIQKESQCVQIVTYDEVFEKLDTLVNLLEGK